MARYTRNDRRESRNAIFGEVNGIVPTGNFLFRKNDGVTVDHTWTQSAQLAVGLPRRLAAVPRAERPPARGPVRSGVARLLAGGRRAVRRRATISRSSTSTRSATSATTSPATRRTRSTRSSRPTRSSPANHSMRAGYDLRKYHEFGENPGRQAGDYADAQRQRVHAADQQLGGAELPGRRDLPDRVPDRRLDRRQRHRAPTTSGTTRCSCRTTGRLTNKLTLNLGLRYDYEAAPTEIENRQRPRLRSERDAVDHQRGRSGLRRPAGSRSPRRPGRRAAASASPPTARRGIWNADKNNIQPRVGFAYKWNDKTVVRGGWGIYTSPFVFSNGINQMGYSQSTPFTATQNNGLTFQSTLSNPYPTGRAAAGRQHARAEHVPRPEPDPVRAARLPERRSCRATWSTCSASCRRGGCSKSATPAATASTSRPTRS